MTVKAGVGVIVCHEKRVLIGERCGSHGEGLFSFPGGHIETTDKSLQACGEREVREETGMIVHVFSPDHYRQDLFTTFDKLGDGKFYVTAYLVADYLWGGEFCGRGTVVPKEPDKCKKWQWVTLDELATLVRTEEQKTWIPVHQVIFYLNQLWGNARV